MMRMNDGIYPFATSVDSLGDDILQIALAANDADLYAVKGDNESVTFALINPADDANDAPFAADADIQYNAASEHTLTFRFEADNTTIKDGTVSVRIPSGWSPTPVLPNDDGDNAGRVTAKMYANEAVRRWRILWILPTGTVIAKEEISVGRTITLTVDKLPIDGVIVVTYHTTTVQRNADTVDFIGEFKTRSGARSRRAGRIEVEVLNVENGSGNCNHYYCDNPPLFCKSWQCRQQDYSEVYRSRNDGWRSSDP